MRRLARVMLAAAVGVMVYASIGAALGTPANSVASAHSARFQVPMQPARPLARAVGQSTLAGNPQVVAGSQGGGNLASGGGPVQANPKVYLIFWGSEWGTTAAPSPNAQLVKRYFQDLGPSYFDNVLTQYSNISNVVTLGGAYVDTAAPPTDTTCGGATVEDGSIQSEVSGAIAAAGWATDGSNALYLVFTPSSTSVNNGTGACSEQLFCSYHKWSSSAGVAYAAVPYPNGGACQVTSSPHNNVAGDSLVNLASGMQFGAVTDPQPGSGNAPTFPQSGSGWVDGTGLEISQKCAWNFAGGATPLTNADTFEVQTEYSNAQNGCTNAYAPHMTVSPSVISAWTSTPASSPGPQVLTLQNTGVTPLNWQVTPSSPTSRPMGVRTCARSPGAPFTSRPTAAI